MILLIDALAGVLVMAGRRLQCLAGRHPADACWVLSGYMQINVFTWIQRRVPPQMMGRAMSIFMFIFMGLAPLSAAATGWLLTLISLSQMFVGGGIILVTFAALAYLFTPIRSITANARRSAKGQRMETKWLEDFISLVETNNFSRSAALRHDPAGLFAPHPVAGKLAGHRPDRPHLYPAA
jgi:drug/metabolite transporter superfamily protein YnfA